MYYGRKKGIIIAIIVIVAVIVLATAGVLTFMFTDLFKSKKTLFWKYVGVGLENNKTQNLQLEDVEKLKLQKPYTIEGELTASSTDEEVDAFLEKTKINLETESDKVNNYTHTKAKLNYADATLLNLDYANSEDIYALKSDEIVTVYLGIRNENLNVLLQKLGISATVTLPDKITPVNYAELFKLSDEEKEHIKQTYTDVLINSIPDENYSKQTEAIIEKDGISYNTTSYRLDLTGVQISEIIQNILNTLKTDSITLNMLVTKAKTLGIEEEYATIDGINEIIDNLISELQEAEITDTSFVVYSHKGATIATEILIRNQQKYTIYNGETNAKITVEDLTDTEDYDVLEMDIMYKASSTESNMDIKLSTDGEEVITLSMVNIGSATQGNVQSDVTVILNDGEESLDLTYSQTLEFVDELESVEKLDETNCAILNDYTQEDLNTLLQAVGNQIVTVFTQKAQMLGLIPQEQQVVQQEVIQ